MHPDGVAVGLQGNTVALQGHDPYGTWSGLYLNHTGEELPGKTAGALYERRSPVVNVAEVIGLLQPLKALHVCAFGSLVEPRRPPPSPTCGFGFRAFRTVL